MCPPHCPFLAPCGRAREAQSLSTEPGGTPARRARGHTFQARPANETWRRHPEHGVCPCLAYRLVALCPRGGGAGGGFGLLWWPGGGGGGKGVGLIRTEKWGISNFPGFPCYCLNGLNSSLRSSDSAIWADSNMGTPESKKCHHFFVTHMSNPPSPRPGIETATETKSS